MKACSSPGLMPERSLGVWVPDWGETGGVGAVHPSSPITFEQAVSPTKGVCFGDKLRHVQLLIGDKINPVFSASVVAVL